MTFSSAPEVTVIIEIRFVRKTEITSPRLVSYKGRKKQSPVECNRRLRGRAKVAR